MSLQQLRKEISELKEAAKIKKALPWYCENLMSRYKEERARREILYKLYDITGEVYDHPGPYRLEVEDVKLTFRPPSKNQLNFFIRTVYC